MVRQGIGGQAGPGMRSDSRVTTRHRVTFVQTHPVQYMAPWFRYIATNCRDIELTVLYASTPTREQQGIGFGEAFHWDVGLTEGYSHRILAPADSNRSFDSDSFTGADVRGVEEPLLETRPDVVVVPGWHSAFYLRAITASRRHRIPVLYRGDSNLVAAPSGLRHLPWKLRTRAALKMFDGYLSVGTPSRDYLRRFGVPEPLIFDSPHCVDNAWFGSAAGAVRERGREAARRDLEAGADDFVVLFAGKFTAVKRPLDVIEAAARLGSNVVVALAGNGPLVETARRTAARLNVRVSWQGFVNQSAMPRLFAAADCVAVPSRSETWGLLVNEALASGTPCVVSNGVGAARDLIHEQSSGDLHETGDVDELAAALTRVRDALRRGTITVETCQQAVRGFVYERATDGVTQAARRLRARKRTSDVSSADRPRVIALFGNMVSVFGLERMSFEVLRTLRENGGAVHCIVNRWQSSRIVDFADDIDASWSTGYYWYELRRRGTLAHQLRTAWDVCNTSFGLLRDARRFRPSHIFIPEFGAVLRSAPALWILRRCGVRTILRLGNAPEPGTFYAFIWRHLVDPCVDHYVPNSQFIQHELLRHRINPRKSRVIYNTVPHRPDQWQQPSPIPGRVIFVGQVIPQKGLDLLLEAVAQLRSQGIDVTLDVVGDIDGYEDPAYVGYRAGVRKRAAAPDLSAAVRLLGVREDVPLLMSHASIHCLPSRPEQKEGFTVTTLEAKRAGLPSVVTRSGALPEMVRHGVDGWLCESTTVEAIAEGLEHFLADPEGARRAGEEARSSQLAFGRVRFRSEWAELFSLPANLRGSTVHTQPS
jgi:glycosyltransferase involved in cell wall biosynthesis